MSQTTTACGPTVQVASEPVRLLALLCDARGDEAYLVACADGDGRLRHRGGGQWELTVAKRRLEADLGSPDAVFTQALGAAARPFSPSSTPHWPAAITARLARRGLSGAGVIAFDADWFLAKLTTSAMDRPMLLPDAAAKLGLVGLQGASAWLRRRSGERLAPMLLQALDGETGDWGGEGRLIGEFPTGELAQLGADIGEGGRAALGAGPLRVVFEPGAPLGLGLGPFAEGVWVGEVDPGSAAERAGVTVGMVVRSVSGDASLADDLDDVLDAIDHAVAARKPLAITFDTASVATHLYAVEMPAASALAALGTEGSVDTGEALAVRCGGALLWRESTPRLFLGESGSVTSAHTDICPQLQLAQGVLGSKVLGIATHAATRRLSASHGGDDDPAHVPTDRPLSDREARLLQDRDVSLVHLQAGDLAVFDSGALHFASHGVDGLHGAVYQGIMTPGGVPRLRLAASRGGPRDAAYQDHLNAANLLRLVADPLAACQASQRAARAPEQS